MKQKQFKKNLKVNHHAQLSKLAFNKDIAARIILRLFKCFAFHSSISIANCL